MSVLPSARKRAVRHHASGISQSPLLSSLFRIFRIHRSAMVADAGFRPASVVGSLASTGHKGIGAKKGRRLLYLRKEVSTSGKRERRKGCIQGSSPMRRQPWWWPNGDSWTYRINPCLPRCVCRRWRGERETAVKGRTDGKEAQRQTSRRLQYLSWLAVTVQP